MQSLKKRTIEVHFLLDKKITFQGENNVKVVDDSLDVSIQVKKLGGSDSAMVNIKNMAIDDIDLLIKLRFKPLQQLNNRVLIYAGYDGVKTLIFQGNIVKTNVTFGQDTIFQCECLANVYYATTPNPATYHKGTQNIDNIFSELCQKSGLVYRNIDVKGLTISNPILKGGVIEQIKQLAEMLEISYVFDNDQFIIKRVGTPSSNDIVDINVNSGLIGYPTIDDIGIVLTTQFNANIIFDGKIKVESNFKQANGIWRVYSLDHSISSRGVFETLLKAVPIGGLS